MEGGLDPAMVPLNDSLAVDHRLWAYDVRGSRAWAGALTEAGVLTPDEGRRLDEGLERLARRFTEDGGPPVGGGDEDIHSLVERLLRDEVGELAGKLHTGRSRNDQVATDLRLWGMDACDRARAHVRDLVTALTEWADGSLDLFLPGFTHLQQGQPVRAAHWVLSHAWPLVRDADRFAVVRREASVLPLGSGAIAGCPFPVDRDALARTLGFERVSENSIDAVADRDWAAAFAFAGALLGVHLSRLGEDLVLFASREFGYVRLSDGFSTGSSLMPQKRNPDVAELTRGRSARLSGALVHVLTLLKGLPTGYNRDLQEDKPALFAVHDTLGVVLPALTGAVRGARFVPERLEAALDPALYATDLADLLVGAGVPFREAHEVVAGLVRRAEETGRTLAELPDEVLAEAHPALGEVGRAVFSPDRSTEARSSTGGTARARVEEQLERLRAWIGDTP